MKHILRIAYKVVLTSAAALLGNWIGGQIHMIWTGERVPTIQFTHTTEKGPPFNHIPVNTKL